LFEDKMMSDYSIALYLHIVGALGTFAALGVEWASLRRLRSVVTVAQAREWFQVATSGQRIGGVSMLVLLLSGVYMMVTVWGGVPWITVTIGTLLLLALPGIPVSRRMATIQRTELVKDGSVSSSFSGFLQHPLLWVFIQTRITVVLGIVFLMTVKPDLPGSLLTIGIAIILGLTSSLAFLDRKAMPAKMSTFPEPDEAAQ
jgi:hypothetical protein